MKVLLYQAMHSEGVRKSDLARRMSLPRQEVDRILDLNHGTALAKMELAFEALGKQIDVAVASRSKAHAR
jgi:antitoxin HicB